MSSEETWLMSNLSSSMTLVTPVAEPQMVLWIIYGRRFIRNCQWSRRQSSGGSENLMAHQSRSGVIVHELILAAGTAWESFWESAVTPSLFLFFFVLIGSCKYEHVTVGGCLLTNFLEVFRSGFPHHYIYYWSEFARTAMIIHTWNCPCEWNFFL